MWVVEMKLINREPTKEMIEAGWEALQNTPGHSAAVMFRAMYDAAPEVEQEPVAIYHGKCVVDCGDAGHPNVSLLKLIPAGTELYAIPPDAQAKIAKRDARIAELESERDDYGDDAAQLKAKVMQQAARIKELEKKAELPMKYKRMQFNAELQEEVKKQAAEISRLKGVIAKCKETLVSNISDLQEPNFVTLASWRVKEALAAIKEEGL